MKVALRIFLLCISAVIINDAFASDKADSLNHLLSTSEDKAKTEIYIELCDILVRDNPEKCIEYAKEAIILATAQNRPQCSEQALYYYGRSLYYLYQYDSATFYLEKAIQLSKTHKLPQQSKRAYYYHGKSNYLLGNYNSAIAYFNIYLELTRSKPDTILSGLAFYYCGRSYYKERKYDSAIAYFDKTLIIHKTNNDTLRIANDLLWKSRSLYKKSMFDESNTSAFKALEFYEKTNNKAGIARCYQRISSNYTELGEYNKSLDATNSAHKYFIQAKDTNGIGDSYIRMGIIYSRWNNQKKSLEYYRKSKEFFEKTGHLRGISTSLNNMGTVYIEWGNYEKALNCYNQAIDINESLNYLTGISTNLVNIGDIYYHQHRYNQAIENYNNSLNIRIQQDNEKGIASVYYSLGKTHIATQDYKQAELFFVKSMTIAIKIKQKDRVLRNYKAMAELFKLQNNYKKAFTFFIKYTNLKDSLFNEEKYSQLHKIEDQYKYEKKQKEIELQNKTIEIQQLEIRRSKNLRVFLIVFTLMIITILVILFYNYRIHKQSNIILKETNARLKILNTTKDKFLSIIAHDLSTPIIAFKTITNSIIENYNNMSTEQILPFLKEINNSSNYVYGLLQNLLQWTRSQTKEISFQPIEINLTEIITDNISLQQINAQNNNITISTEICSSSNVLADYNMTSTIIRNLLTNAIKFTNEGGSIIISTKKADDYVEISIEDTGIGISEEDLKKLFRIDIYVTAIGKSKNKGTGLGLLLCKEFVEINNGTIWVESKIDKGSIFKILLPIFVS